MSSNSSRRSSSTKNVKVLPTKDEWRDAWAVSRRDFKSNVLGFIGIILFFTLLYAAGFAWNAYFGGGNSGQCYEGAPGASGVPVKQVEC